MAVCFVACLVLFAWGLCIAALLCLVCLIVGGQFRTITCRQIRLAHSSVCQGSHTLAHPSDLRLDKGCKTLLSLSLSLSLTLRVLLDGDRVEAQTPYSNLQIAVYDGTRNSSRAGGVQRNHSTEWQRTCR